jgi:hypothetical protein
MRERRSPSQSPQAHGLSKVTLLVPENCAEGLRQFARELCARHRAGPAPLAPEWRTVAPSAELMVDPECRARCAIRDTGASGGKRFHWTVTVLGHSRPVAAGRTGELTEARWQAEAALAAYMAARGEMREDEAGDA